MPTIGEFSWMPPSDPKNGALATDVTDAADDPVVVVIAPAGGAAEIIANNPARHALANPPSVPATRDRVLGFSGSAGSAASTDRRRLVSEVGCRRPRPSAGVG